MRLMLIMKAQARRFRHPPASATVGTGELLAKSCFGPVGDRRARAHRGLRGGRRAGVHRRLGAAPAGGSAAGERPVGGVAAADGPWPAASRPPVRRWLAWAACWAALAIAGVGVLLLWPDLLAVPTGAWTTAIVTVSLGGTAVLSLRHLRLFAIGRRAGSLLASFGFIAPGLATIARSPSCCTRCSPGSRWPPSNLV